MTNRTHRETVLEKELKEKESVEAEEKKKEMDEERKKQSQQMVEEELQKEIAAGTYPTCEHLSHK